MPLLVAPLATATHNIAKASPCPLRLMMATEGAWDAGCFLTCLVAAALAALHAPLWIGLLLALPPLAGGAWFLRQFYPAPPVA